MPVFFQNSALMCLCEVMWSCVVAGFSAADGGGSGGVGRASGFGRGTDYDNRPAMRPGRGGFRGSMAGSRGRGRGFDRF